MSPGHATTLGQLLIHSANIYKDAGDVTKHDSQGLSIPLMNSTLWESQNSAQANN